jgi:hypothetical protein
MEKKITLYPPSVHERDMLVAALAACGHRVYVCTKARGFPKEIVTFEIEEESVSDSY